MTSAEVLKQATISVEKLLVQYTNYLEASARVASLRTEHMALAIKMGAQTGKPFTAILAEQPAELQMIATRIQQAEEHQQQISDEMTFANPVVWMMYKYRAYAGTSQEIGDMQDFRKHCSKPGYICTKRYQFLNDTLKKQGEDLNDTHLFPDAMKLPEVYSLAAMLKLVTDPTFAPLWNEHEYHRDNGRVAKWETYSA